MLARLLDLLFPARDDERALRGLPAEGLLPLLEPELAPLGGGESAVVLMRYADSRVRAAIHEAKYRGSERAFSLLAEALAEYLRDEPLKRARLLPLPLGKARRRERGYNQAEEVARRAGQALTIPLETALLARTRETRSQVSLPRWRRKQNMRGAFRCAENAAPDPALLYIVVDDVLTTGATLRAATSALRAAGAARILAIALAH
ncbi:MAG TPA: ComF family protein [Candidatus Paceibacterota bacterium]|nr:ComF family protein [Candidatus Paceibacterota bacterium]